MTDILVTGALSRRPGRPPKNKSSRLRTKNERASSEVATSSKITYPTNDKCLIVQDFEKDAAEIKETMDTCLCEVQDEFMASESCCSVSTPDSGYHDSDSSPLTKLNFKPETDETASKVADKLTGTRENDRKHARTTFKRTPRSFQESINSDTPSDHLKTEIIKCSAEIGFGQCSKKYGISVDTIKAFIQSWINPGTEEPTLPSKDEESQGSEPNVSEQLDVKSPDLTKNMSPVKRPRGRPPKNAKNNSDLSELPLSHVKLMRKKLVKSIKIDKKKNKCKKLLLKQKLNGTVKLKSQKEKIKKSLFTGQKKKTIKTKVPESEPNKSSSLLVKPEPHQEAPLFSSVTVFDADVARPSRPIHRPVRYLDSLNQNAENFAVKKLNIVDKFDLPYDKDSLVWNKQHSKNKQVCVDY